MADSFWSQRVARPNVRTPNICGGATISMFRFGGLFSNNVDCAATALLSTL